MTKAEYLETMGQVVLLVSCAVQGRIPEREQVERMDPDRVYEAAAYHQLSAAAGMALESAGYTDSRFRQAIACSQRRTVLLDRDRAEVLTALEEAGIWHMPLKGAVLKDLYPLFGMREMADNDILVDPERMKDVRDIMIRLGFSTKQFGTGAHDIYYKKPFSNFEMHRTLFDWVQATNLDAYYEHVRERLIRDDGKRFGYHFSEEDFYLYLTAHEYKHFSHNGTGLRSLLDIFVFLQKRNPDPGYVAWEAEKMGIAGFERENRELALNLFRGEALDDDQREMFEYIASSGTYGQLMTGVRKEILKQGRLRFFFRRLVPSYRYMVQGYPSLRKVPYLYPVYCIYRLVLGFFPARRKQAATEIKAIVHKTEKNTESLQKGERT